MSDPREERARFPVIFRVEFPVLWAAAAVVTLALYVAVPRSAWNDPLLPLPSRIGLAGFELVALAGVMVFLASGLAIFTVIARKSGRSPWLSWGGVVTATVVAWLLIFAYLTSWGIFRATGRFLDLATFTILRANAVQLAQHVAHMAPALLMAVPIVSLLAAVAVTVLLPRLAVRVDRPKAQRVMILTIVVLLACVGAGWAGSRYTVTQMYKFGGLSRVGPLMALSLDGARYLARRSDPMHRAPEVPLQQRAIVPMEEYLAAADTSAARRYNVIVVVVESLRSDQLRATGGPRDVMPTVDSIARHARVFSRNYTQSSHSDYADLAIFSSHYPLRSSQYHIYPENPTYPRVMIYDVLKALGYQVGVFSSQNESWSGMINYLQTGSIDHLLHAETYEGPTQVPRNDPEFYKFVRGSKRSGKIDDRFTVSEAIDWIDGLGDEPFFIYMNLQNSHVPYETPADFPVRFGTGKVSFPLQFGYFPPDSVDVVMDLYANSLAYVDAQIARLVGHLQAGGLWERTILVVTGDTGQAFFEHGFAGHANALYDEVMRVPLIVRSPNIEPGTDSRLAQHVDVPPSVLYLIGLPPHPSFQGRNLFADEGEEPVEDRYAFLVAQAAAHQYAIVDGRFKLIFDAGTGEYLLYDLEDDPAEIEDLSDVRTADLRRLARRLHAWRRAQLDYYQNPMLHGDWYPPVVPDSLPRSPAENDAG